MTNSTPGMIALAGVFAWGIYRRIRRNIGRQELRPRRLILRLVILGLVSVFILSTALVRPHLGLGFGSGVLLGAALALLGLRHTKFETTEDGHYYTPNTYLGVALTLLLVGRMAYRLNQFQNLTSGNGQPAPFQSPLTLLIFGLNMGYYLAYYTGLFVHTHDPKPPGPPA